MPIDPSEPPPELPERPNLRHLKEQAKDLLRSGAAASTTDAQFQIFHAATQREDAVCLSFDSC